MQVVIQTQLTAHLRTVRSRIKKGESIKLLNIPVGATYKITEKNVIGYVPYKVGNQDFNGTFVGTLAEAENALNFINKVNPTNIAISVNKTLDGQAYSGSKFVYTLTGLESMDTTKPDADGKPIKTNSAKTISTNLETPDASGKVEFKDLKLVTAGVYRFKITELLPRVKMHPIIKWIQTPGLRD